MQRFERVWVLLYVPSVSCSSLAVIKWCVCLHCLLGVTVVKCNLVTRRVCNLKVFIHIVFALLVCLRLALGWDGSGSIVQECDQYFFSLHPGPHKLPCASGSEFWLRNLNAPVAYWWLKSTADSDGPPLRNSLYVICATPSFRRNALN